MTDETAHGWGLATVVTGGAGTGTVLDTWFPAPSLGPAEAGATAPEALAAQARDYPLRRVRTEAVLVEIDLAEPPRDVPDAYLRLHLLSHRLVRPHGLSLDGIFGVLTNVVWTNAGPCPVDDFETTRLRLRDQQAVQVFGVDKFPRMTDYVVPSGVRIADADRVRLGAHLAEGTTVMHEGFVNYNAGTLGASMVEGRITAGVVVGDGSDVGGGASIMGTLSGGGTQVVSIGRALPDRRQRRHRHLARRRLRRRGRLLRHRRHQGDPSPTARVVKALELSGLDHMLFRRNSVTGTVEVVPWRAGGVALNEALHAELMAR